MTAVQKPFNFKPRANSFQTTSVWLLLPWLIVLIILGTSFMLAYTCTVIPGNVAITETSKLQDGLLRGLMMIAVPYERSNGNTSVAVFFDDERYEQEQGKSWSRLIDKINSHSNGRHEVNLLIDRRIPHGQVVEIVNALNSADIRRINLIQKPQ